jgi:hypothetical protein
VVPGWGVWVEGHMAIGARVVGVLAMDVFVYCCSWPPLCVRERKMYMSNPVGS